MSIGSSVVRFAFQSRRAARLGVGLWLGSLGGPVAAQPTRSEPRQAPAPADQAAPDATAPAPPAPLAPPAEPPPQAAMSGPGTAMHALHAAGPLGIPRARLGSGTSWLPDSSPMHGLMASLGGWAFMLHGNVFVGYDWFGSDRGGGRLISTNAFMGMAWRPLGPGEFMGRLMLSLEPLTVGKRGYPLIFQTGEAVDGQSNHDRQHPHDLFMEIAAAYSLPLSDELALAFYLAAAGEPALGPTAFPHRVSAESDPLAPIGHHWQDATHISFGVVTAGVFNRALKFEVSWFNGREPDDNRWDLDLELPDSFAVRLTWNPTPDWSLEASYGHLDNPESQTPGVSVDRMIASSTFNHRFDSASNWATTMVVSQNAESNGHMTRSILAESTWDMVGPHVVFGRLEYVRKTGDDLALPFGYQNRAYDLGLLGLGYVYEFGPFESLTPGAGVRASLGFAESALDRFYGTEFPVGVMIFAQLRPVEMSHH